MIRDQVTPELIEATVKSAGPAIMQRALNLAIMSKLAIKLADMLKGDLPIAEVVEALKHTVGPELKPLGEVFHMIEAFHANERAKLVKEIVRTYNLSAEVAVQIVLAPNPTYSMLQGMIDDAIRGGKL